MVDKRSWREKIFSVRKYSLPPNLYIEIIDFVKSNVISSEELILKFLKLSFCKFPFDINKQNCVSIQRAIVM
jgi:hypothetical protein